jgi:hypothetical protein
VPKAEMQCQSGFPKNELWIIVPIWEGFPDLERGISKILIYDDLKTEKVEFWFKKMLICPKGIGKTRSKAHICS